MINFSMSIPQWFFYIVATYYIVRLLAGFYGLHRDRKRASVSVVRGNRRRY